MQKFLPKLQLLTSLLVVTYHPGWAQSPWVPVAGAPNYFNGLPAGSFHISAPAPNVLWGSFQSATVQGYNFQDTFRTLDNGQSWEQSGSGIELSALDAQTAFLIDAAGLKRTITGPRGFVSVAGALPANTQLIHFFTLAIGVAATADSYGIPGPIYRTINGGSTWTWAAAAPATPAGAYNVYFRKCGIGSSLWLSTSGGDVLHTTDAGLTWTATGGVGQVAFEDEQHGLAYKQYPQALARTVDGGQTWIPVPFSGQPLFNSITAVPGLAHTYISVGYTSGFTDVGVSAISRDNGTSWQLLATDNFAFNEVIATSPTQIWASTVFNYRSNAPSNMLLRYNGMALAKKKQEGTTVAVAAYPNPSTGQTQLIGPLQGSEELRLFDGLGHLCQIMTVSDSHRTVDLSKQPTGLYYLTLTAANGTVRRLRINRE
ncbi:T9SS type A sorting domain-containing protein [Hymenobacter sp. DH14]|uniref:T9SS type A sorting domain-containing protein n=1 Tax=Hymenobacter cyanobacteriorum TaxID=2926463 RepID=A0A9X2ADT9_9BACT|nr:T9SS type A sorting domain-containing protein [Hymenobacter cyanobacteriorum]MCI1186082.1 T9SS type A sorting domain-containing protein [Hymenobacter cyanobacteriorum]